MKKILVISPHPDDEVFGCGAWLLKVFKKCELSFLLLSNSDIRHRDGIEVSGGTRLSEYAHVVKELDGQYMNGSCVDTKLLYQLPEMIEIIETAFDTFEPDTVLFPYKSFHQDHLAVYKACFAALRPGRVKSVNNVICYEIPNYVWYSEGDIFMPNFYVPFDESLLEEKLKLCNLYGSQVSRPSSPIDLGAIKRHAEYRGWEINKRYAEAFRIIRMINNGVIND